MFKEVKRHFNNAELVELTGVCGTFAATNRFQDSLKLPIEPQTEIDKIKFSVHANPDGIKAYIGQIVRSWPRDFPTPAEDARQPYADRRAGDTAKIRDSAGSAAFSPENAAPRLELLNPRTAQGETERYFKLTQQLLGGSSNAVRIWAHSPYIVKLFLPFKVALEREGVGSILPARLKTLVRVRTSQLNRAPYSLAHGIAFGRALGIREEQLAALGAEGGAVSPHFSSREHAALQWAEQVVTNTAKRRDDLFHNLQQHFDDAEIVELTGLCAVSNMVDLIQNALRVPLESDEQIQAMNREVVMDPQRLKAYLKSIVDNWPHEFPVPVD